MEVPIIGELVDFFTRVFGLILAGIVSYRVLMAYGQDNDIKIWKAVFWSFIAVGFIVMGKDVITVFQSIWHQFILR